MDQKNSEKYELVKAHLSQPWGSLTATQESKIADLVHFPLKDPNCPGGLTKKGNEWAVENGHNDLIELSKLHKERTRIDIHAILKSAWLYAKSKKEGLTESEKEVLFGGITLGSEFEKLQTVKKGGKLLASGFVDKLGSLHKKLKENNMDGKSNNFIKVVEQAAIIHKKAEKEDKEVSEKIAGL
jgi:hypothetical protein